MPTWRGVSGEELRLEVVGYQFPHISEGYDANWLFVEIEARNEQGAWSARVPCLLTWEVSWIARWLEAVVEGNADDRRFSVLESDLQLLYIGRAQGRHRFAGCLSYGLSFTRSTDGDRSIIVVAMTDAEVTEAVSYFRGSASEFPPRGEAGQKGMLLPGPRILCEDDV